MRSDMETRSSATGVLREIGPREMGFKSRAISATGRLESAVLTVAGYSQFSLSIVTVGGTDVGRAELEVTGYALNDATVLRDRTVILGGTADIFLVAASPSIVTWGTNVAALAFTPPTTATFVAAALEPFRLLPRLKFELNVTTLDAAALVSMYLHLFK